MKKNKKFTLKEKLDNNPFGSSGETLILFYLFGVPLLFTVLLTGVVGLSGVVVLFIWLSLNAMLPTF